MKLSLEGNKFLQIVIALEAERAVGDSHLEELKNDYYIPFPTEFSERGELDLSILLPVWNPDRAQFMRCLNAVKAAKLDGISHEVLISDNASSTPVVAECIAASGLQNVRYVRQEQNIGGFPNFNYCLANAKGRWLHILSHDDWIDPDFYQNLLKGAADSSGTDLRFCRCRLYDEGAPTHRLMYDEAPQPCVLVDFMDRQVAHQRIQLVSAVVSRRAVKAVGAFNAALGAGADWEYWSRVGSRFGVFYHSEPVATYVLHQASWSQKEGNFEDADSFRKFRRILLRILLSVPREKRHGAARAFMLNMTQRLLAVATRNKRSGQLPKNRILAEALMPATKEAGLLPELEFVLATFN